MDLPDGFAFREPAPDDLESVADVLAAEQSANGRSCVVRSPRSLLADSRA